MTPKAVVTMTTEKTLWLLEHPTTAPAAVCHCGQELDCCAGTHCPRCGTRLAARAA